MLHILDVLARGSLIVPIKDKGRTAEDGHDPEPMAAEPDSAIELHFQLANLALLAIAKHQTLIPRGAE